MEIKIKNYVPFMQEGGEVAPAADAAPTEPDQTQGADDGQQLLAAAQEALQAQDCQLAMQVLQALLQQVGEAAPAQPQGEPVYRKGGQLVRRIKK